MSTAAVVVEMSRKAGKQPEKKRQRGVYEKPRGSGRSWIRYADAPGRIRRERAPSKGAGITLYQKRKPEVFQGRKLPETLRKPAPSFKTVAQNALAHSRAHKRSYRDDEYRMDILLEWFGYRTAETITPQEIEARFPEKAWAPATCDRYRALLSFVHRIAVRTGQLADNPARKIARRRENSGRVRLLDTEQEKALREKIRGLAPEREPELDLALYMGMRRNEQYRLRWEHVDFKSRLVMAGVDLRTVTELLGHRTLQMVMRYAHLAPGHVRQAVDRLVAQPNQNATDTKTDTEKKMSVVASGFGGDIRLCLVACHATMRKWRNWQTRRT